MALPAEGAPTLEHHSLELLGVFTSEWLRSASHSVRACPRRVYKKGPHEVSVSVTSARRDRSGAP